MSSLSCSRTRLAQGSSQQPRLTRSDQRPSPWTWTQQVTSCRVVAGCTSQTRGRPAHRDEVPDHGWPVGNVKHAADGSESALMFDQHRIFLMKTEPDRDATACDFLLLNSYSEIHYLSSLPFLNCCCRSADEEAHHFVGGSRNAQWPHSRFTNTGNVKCDQDSHLPGTYLCMMHGLLARRF